MGLDFSGAPTEQGGELIPEGTLAFAVIYIRPKSEEFQKILHTGKDNPDNKYLDCEIELTSGPFIGRKVFHMLGVAGSEKWVNMSMAGIRHILEVGKQAGASNPQGYMIGANLPDGDERMWMELNGLQCAIKVGVEKGRDGYKDKNRVAQFLSPNPDSSTCKAFTALAGGATSDATEQKRAAPAAPSWGGAPAQTSAPAQTQPATGALPSRASWTGTPPPQQGQAGGAAGAKVPF